MTSPALDSGAAAPPPAVVGSRRDRPAAAPRIAGLDLARFLALVGMMCAHTWFATAAGEPALLASALSGKPAALFAVLAGVGIALTTRAPLAAGDVRAARLAVLGRGLALVLIGLTLGLSPGGVVVILVYYGVAFWLTIPVLAWPSRAIAIVAGALAVGWQPVSMLLRADLEQPFELGSASWLSLGEPLSFVRGLFVTGTYPVMTWIVYVLVGLLVGRLLVAARERGAVRRLGGRLIAWGALASAAAFALSALLTGPVGGLDALTTQEVARLQAIASSPGSSDAATDAGAGDPVVEADEADEAAGPGAPDPLGDPAELVREQFFATGMGAANPMNPWYLASPAPHTGTFFDLAITAGLAVAVLGGCLALGTMLPPLARRLLAPVAAAGAAPLTVYALHVLAVGVAAIVGPATLGDGADALEHVPWWASSGRLWLAHTALALLAGAILAALRRRGPLETLVTWTGRRFARLASASRRAEGRSRTPGPGPSAPSASAPAAPSEQRRPTG